MNFKDLNLKKDYLTNSKSFVYTDKDNIKHQISVKTTIPVADKFDLFEITFQKAEINGQYNELLLEVFFHLNMIYLYTDIDFSAEDRLDQMELYDILENNSIIDNIIAIMEQTSEYTNLKNLFIQQLNRNVKYKGSAAGVLQTLVQDLPRSAQAAKNIVDGFNVDDYKNVVEFAQMANGGRPIPNATTAATVNK